MAEAVEKVLCEFSIKSCTNSTVLVREISAGAYRQVKALVQRGSSVNGASGQRNIRPLMVACYIADPRKRQTIVNFLLQNGADATLTDARGRNALFYACALSVEGVLSALLKYSEFDLNAVDNDGNTALHVCAMAGNAQVMRKLLAELLKYQLNVSIKNYSFLTPLGVALIGRRKACAEMLHHAGGCPKFSENFFSSILQSMDTTTHSPDSEFGSTHTPMAVAMQSIEESVEVCKAFSVHDGYPRRHLGSRRNFQMRSRSQPSTIVSESRDSVTVERKYSMHTPINTGLINTSLPTITRSHTKVSLMAQQEKSKASSFSLHQNVYGVQYLNKACVQEGSAKYAARSFHHWRRFTKQTKVLNSAATDHIKSILTEVYPSQKTPSYCHSSKGPVSIDSEWVEKVKKYQSCSPVPCECKEVNTPSSDPPKRYSLTRALSISPSFDSPTSDVRPQSRRPSSR